MPARTDDPFERWSRLGNGQEAASECSLALQKSTGHVVERDFLKELHARNWASLLQPQKWSLSTNSEAGRASDEIATLANTLIAALLDPEQD